MPITRQRARAQRAADVPSTAVLGDDVLLMIFDELNADSENAICAATRVCRRWHVLAQRVLDATIGPLIFSSGAQRTNTRLFSRLESDANFRQRVHSFVVADWHPVDLDLHRLYNIPMEPKARDPYAAGGFFSKQRSNRHRERDGTMMQIVSLTEQLHRIKLHSFTWRAISSMPDILVRTLSSQPACLTRIETNDSALDIAKWSYAPYINATAVQLSTTISTQLQTLQIMLPAADRQLASEFGLLLQNCPALRYLKIRAVGRLWRRNFIPQALHGGPMAKFETMKSTDWLPPTRGVHQPPLVLKSLSLRNTCLCGTRLTSLHQAIVLKQLRTLETDCISILALCSTECPTLSSLQLYVESGRDFTYPICDGGDKEKVIRQALEDLTNLRSLGIDDGTRVFEEALETAQLSRLESLALHEHTTPYQFATNSASYDRPLLSLGSLRHLAKACPRLRSLAVDVPYADHEYEEYLLSTAHELSALHSLSAFREIEQNGTEHAATRGLNVAVDPAPAWDLNMMVLEGAPAILGTVRHFSAHLLPRGKSTTVQMKSAEVMEAARMIKAGASGPYPKFWASELLRAEHQCSSEDWFHSRAEDAQQ